MWIRRIVLENFKPYKGRTEIEFNIECNGKHISCIYGDNGFGKTSILDAIYWGLYGSRARDTKILFNDKSLSEGNNKMYVEITFYDAFQNREIVIIRRAEKVGSNVKERLDLIINGEAEYGDSAYKQDIIDQLIPYEISKFFFFDAEDVKNLAKEQGGDLVRDSVEMLLGLKSIREAISDLDDVRGEFERALQKFLKNKVKYEDLSKELEKIDQEIKQLEKKKSDKVEELKNKQRIRSELRKELAESSHREARELELKRKELEKKISQLNKEKEKIEKEIEEHISNQHLLILKSEFLEIEKELEKKLQTIKHDQDILRELKAKIKSLKETIEESKCPVCGRIIYDDREIEKLENELKELEMEYPDIEERLRKVENEYANYNSIYLQIKRKIADIEMLNFEVLHELRIKLKEKNEEIADTKKEIDKIGKRLENLGVELISRIEDEINKITKSISELESEIKRIDNELEKHYADKRKLEKRIWSLSVSSDEISEIQAKIEFIDTLKTALQEYLDKIVDKRRKDIIQTSSEIFLKLTNKKDEYVGFEFSSSNNYKFQIICKDGSKPNMDTISYGEMEVVALSFILGLSRYSQIKAPIVTDTLFGRLSPYVQENIAKLFSELDSQIILLVLKDDRPEGKTEIDQIAHIFRNNICNEYIIVRDQISRTSQIIKEKVLGVS